MGRGIFIRVREEMGEKREREGGRGREEGREGGGRDRRRERWRERMGLVGWEETVLSTSAAPAAPRIFGVSPARLESFLCAMGAWLRKSWHEARRAPFEFKR